MEKQYKDLIEKAKKLVGERKLTEECICGEVACALVTDNGNTYVGVSINCACGIGFCAEHSAIASMLSNKESVIKTIVAVDCNGDPISPCGRCREFIYQINHKNKNTDVILSKNKMVKLNKLLPYRWQDSL